ncbi:MAG: hypothetical protein R3Y60_04690 [bacterium]
MRILGIVFAYLALFLLIVLCIKPFIKKSQNEKFKKITIFLTKKHVLISLLFLITFVLHVVLSTNGDFSLYTAKFSMVFLILSIVSAVCIKLKPKVFLKLHYIFAFLCLIMAVLHIIEVNIL